MRGIPNQNEESVFGLIFFCLIALSISPTYPSKLRSPNFFSQKNFLPKIPILHFDSVCQEGV